MACSVQGRPKKGKQVKSKAKSVLNIFFDIKILFWQAKQTIPHTTVTFYGDCVEMCEDFTLNFGDKRTGCCIMTTHCLTLHFLPGNFFTKNNMTVIPHPPYLSDLVPCNFYLFPTILTQLG
jgi:hypothetical protein